MTGSSETIVAGVIAILRRERADMIFEYDAAIRALERLVERRREPDVEVETEEEAPPAAESAPAPSSWPDRIRFVVASVSGAAPWTLDDAARGMIANGWNDGLSGQDLKDRISAYLARMDDVERVERGIYRTLDATLAESAPGNGGTS